MLIAMCGSAWADEGHHGPAWVIDTDLGLDDTVALTMALQRAGIDVHTIVAADGASEATQAAIRLGRMLDEFNRSDVRLYTASESSTAEAPPFRAFVNQALGRVLDGEVALKARAFDPSAYTDEHALTQVVLLGPMTNLAAALRRDPSIKSRIGRVIVAGPGEASRNWNLRRDEAAWRSVREAQLPIVYVEPTPRTAGKPAAWQHEAMSLGAGASVGEMFWRRVMRDEVTRAHYFGGLTVFFDELAVLYAAEPSLFEVAGEQAVRGRDGEAIAQGVRQMLTVGRQRRVPVLLSDRPLPDAMLRPDVAALRDQIVRQHGIDEWSRQLVMNELHDHLGAYSVIGVKMGLRAMELLNAGPHDARVITHVKPGPPTSCINDGVIVATGATPGRAMFEQGDVIADEVAIEFVCNGRRLVLSLKPEYRQIIRRRIGALVKRYGLEDDEYWVQVRRFGLEIWSQWDRVQLFDARWPTRDGGR
ncbi:hypothetical protein HED60_00300 [Planctomycetales bacterium ZRK34]|nr:hypothetical protein HED60_00300 [Planctomycetales bacterium ZRK34]